MRSSVTSEYTAEQSVFRHKSCLKAGAASVLCSFALLPVPAAQAQEAPGAQAPSAPEEETTAILVTGSRIQRNGNDAPTPISVISTDEIQAEAPANIADFVNTLPSVAGSQTAVTNSGSLSNGQSGISSLNLRSLGQNRTLVLLNGQRSVASTSTNLVDINTFPQALIERVEVVTGGASSVYGSDAVAGVVNFVLNTEFTGVEASYEHGVTTYGDVPNHKVQLTAGTDFADGRGHLVVSGEYFTQDGQHSIDRDWNESGFFQIDNPNYTPNGGLPARLVTSGVGSSNFTPGGLITGALDAQGNPVSAGGLGGMYFGLIDPVTGRASTNDLVFGEVSGQWMVGGDYEITSANHRSSNSLANDEDRISLFGRASYDLLNNLNVYAQASYSKFEGYSIYQQTPSVGVTIRSDNAFLPDDVRTMMAENNLSAITIGTSNAGITGSGADTERSVERYVVGADGYFDIGSMGWDWDVYYQHGRTTTRETLRDTWQNQRMEAMQDAVYDGGGDIVCRVNIDDDAANDMPGCVPINRIGVGGVTQEALDYLFAIYPEREQYIGQDVAAANFSTSELFSNWAGPVSLAFGAEYREESVDGYTDPINYETTWLYGNYKVTKGSYNVKEAYVETLFPLLDGLEFNGAARLTDYSISGTVTTWKAGLTWQPIYDVRLRGTVSRDIRAPNLNELFDPGTARTNAVNVPDPDEPGEMVADEFIQNLTGSLELSPEVAKTYGIGVVFTPGFLPGFAASVDYFNIKIEDAIDFVTAQTTANLCFEQNIQQFCDNIRYAAGSTTDIEYIDLAPFNFAEQQASGLDIEASYTMPIGGGDLSLRGLGTYYIENVTDNGIDAPNDSVGVNADGIPTFTYRVTASYALDAFTVGLVGRGFSDGKYDNDFIECATACPPTDPINRTINTNHIDGTFYLDANLGYEFDVGGAATEAYFSVRNLFDRDPVLVGNGPSANNTPAYPQTNRSLYDTLGRTFRIGLRVAY